MDRQALGLCVGTRARAVIPCRAALTSGQWLVIFTNPGNAFIDPGDVNTDVPSGELGRAIDQTVDLLAYHNLFDRPLRVHAFVAAGSAEDLYWWPQGPNRIGPLNCHWQLSQDRHLGTVAMTLRYLGWEGYADGQFASDLREATGLDMEGTNHLSDDAACAMVLAKPSSWDIVNINTPFVRDVLHRKGVIRSLGERFAAETKSLCGGFERFRAPAESPAGVTIGIPLRCGPFNLVVNERSISADVARDEGFGLALNPDFRGRFGVLGYEDFNVMHTAIAAGLDPFQEFNAPAMTAFAAAARTIFEAAALVTTDHRLLNTALIDKEIDFYISGGTYTASCARLAGHREVRAITPKRGPISGKGGVAFVEINAIIDHPHLALAAADTFLDHILSDSGAVAASLAADACNPVVQMQRSSVFERFTPAHLDAMQWQDFEEDMSRCADYALMPDYDRLIAVLRGVSGATLKEA